MRLWDNHHNVGLVDGLHRPDGCRPPQLHNPELGPLIPILAGVAGLFLFGGIIMMFLFDSEGTKAKMSRKKVLTGSRGHQQATAGNPTARRSSR